MTKKISNTDRYQHTPAQIMAMLQNSDYLTEKYTALGDIQFDVVEQTATDGSYVLRIDREVEANLPDFVKKFKETNAMSQTESWAADGDSWSATMTIDASPAKMTGKQVIKPVGDGECDWTVEMEIKVGVPLVGKKIEKVIAEESMKQFGLEYQFNQQWLANNSA